jgi:hypothetical protein
MMHSQQNFKPDLHVALIGNIKGGSMKTFEKTELFRKSGIIP